MKLYKVTVKGVSELLVAASCLRQASEIYSGYTLVTGKKLRDFAIELFADPIAIKDRRSLDELLANGDVGVANYEKDQGWNIERPEYAFSIGSRG